MLTYFSTGFPYKNRVSIHQELTIPGADELDVAVKGKTEKGKDLLRVYYVKRGGKYRRHQIFSGATDTVFTVPGDIVKVTFNADGATTDSGMEVRISIASPTTTFNTIKQEVSKAADHITLEGVNDAKRELSRSVQAFTRLNNQLQSNSDEAPIEETIRALESIAQSYTMLGIMGAKIRQNNAQAFTELDELLARTRKKRATIRAEMEKEEQSAVTLNGQLQQETHRIARRKLDAGIKAAQSLTDSLRTQVLIWTEFYETQVALLEALRSHAEKVDLLFHILEVNAKVYRETANALQLQRNMSLAVRVLGNLSDLVGIIGEIEQSTRGVEALKARLGAVEIGGK